MVHSPATTPNASMGHGGRRPEGGRSGMYSVSVLEIGRRGARGNAREVSRHRISKPRTGPGATKVLQRPVPTIGIVKRPNVIERAAVRTQVSEGSQLDYRHGDDRF